MSTPKTGSKERSPKAMPRRRGQATVELAILMVALVPTFLYVLASDDLMRFRLDLQEVVVSSPWDYTHLDYLEKQVKASPLEGHLQNYYEGLSSRTGPMTSVNWKKTNLGCKEDQDIATHLNGSSGPIKKLTGGGGLLDGLFGGLLGGSSGSKDSNSPKSSNSGGMGGVLDMVDGFLDKAEGLLDDSNKMMDGLGNMDVGDMLNNLGQSLLSNVMGSVVNSVLGLLGMGAPEYTVNHGGLYTCKAKMSVTNTGLLQNFFQEWAGNTKVTDKAKGQGVWEFNEQRFSVMADTWALTKGDQDASRSSLLGGRVQSVYKGSSKHGNAESKANDLAKKGEDEKIITKWVITMDWPSLGGVLGGYGDNTGTAETEFKGTKDCSSPDIEGFESTPWGRKGAAGKTYQEVCGNRQKTYMGRELK
ncbi:MAG: hypothetical protein FWG75_06140 [Cystobacterineae bacterium]|nr:hypothetical protein [Cystobacterineae bacterium]